MHELDRIEVRKQRITRAAWILGGLGFCASMAFLSSSDAQVPPTTDGVLIGIEPSPELRAERGAALRIRVRLTSGRVVLATMPRRLPVLHGTPVRLTQSRTWLGREAYAFQQYRVGTSSTAVQARPGRSSPPTAR